MIAAHEQFDAAEAERRKANALDTLAARRELYVNRGRRALLAAVLRQGTATADDVRAAVQLPGDVSPKCFGSVPGPLARAGIIRHSDFTVTARPVAHARPVTVWELIDRNGAEAWLRDHPPPEKDCPTVGAAGQSANERGLLWQ
jgi:hypothetical protein